MDAHEKERTTETRKQLEVMQAKNTIGGPKRCAPPSGSAYHQSTVSSGTGSEGAKTARHKKKGLPGTKMAKMTNWLTTSEPSSQAFQQHKKDTFQKAGIPLDDPGGQASSKLHAPVGEIPSHAIKPTSVLSPEEIIIRRKQKEADEQRRRAVTGPQSITAPGTSQSSLSGSSLALVSASSSKGSVSYAWDGIPYDGPPRGARLKDQKFRGVIKRTGSRDALVGDRSRRDTNPMHMRKRET
jgi:hypothetical protein